MTQNFSLKICKYYQPRLHAISFCLALPSTSFNTCICILTFKSISTRLRSAAVLWCWPTMRQTDWVSEWVSECPCWLNRQWTWGQCTQTDDLDVSAASCSSCRRLYVDTPPTHPHVGLAWLLWLCDRCWDKPPSDAACSQTTDTHSVL